MAYELVHQYTQGWKQNNLNMIASCLTEDCMIIESHGPIYQGINDIELWFKFWLEAKSTILKWKINSFLYCEEDKTAFCEWDFACISNNIGYDFPGISVVKFSDNKISFIHEYRMTQPAYVWQRNKLESE